MAEASVTFSGLPHIARLQEQILITEDKGRRLCAEIENLGALVADRHTGSVDIPVVIEGRAVLLCYQYGETTISHWHELSENCGARKPFRLSEADFTDKH